MHITWMKACSYSKNHKNRAWLTGVKKISMKISYPRKKLKTHHSRKMSISFSASKFCFHNSVHLEFSLHLTFLFSSLISNTMLSRKLPTPISLARKRHSQLITNSTLLFSYAFVLAYSISDHILSTS